MKEEAREQGRGRGKNTTNITVIVTDHEDTCTNNIYK